MFNWITNRHFYRLCCLLTITGFTSTHAVIPQSENYEASLVHNAAFIAKIKRMVENHLSKKNQSGQSMIDSVVDIKREIESATKIKLNIDDYMAQVASILKKNRVNVPATQLNAIAKKLKSSEKHHKSYIEYLESIMDLENYLINDFDAECFYEAKNKGKSDPDVQMPGELIFGVTAILVGVFLCALQIPPLTSYSLQIIIPTGIASCAHVLGENYDKNKK